MSNMFWLAPCLLFYGCYGFRYGQLLLFFQANTKDDDKAPKSIGGYFAFFIVTAIAVIGWPFVSWIAYMELLEKRRQDLQSSC